MNVRVVSAGDSGALGTALLAVPVFEGEGGAELGGLEAALAPRVREMLGHEDVRATLGSAVVTYPADGEGPRRVLLLGAGAKEKWTTETLRRWAGHAVRSAEKLRLDALSLRLHPGTLGVEDAARAAAEGASLAAWRFRELKTDRARPAGEEPPRDVTSVDLVVDDGEREAAETGARIGRAVAAGQNLARTLQSRPGNVATPAHLAEEAERMASEVGLEVEIFGPDRIRAENMYALLAVNRGSDEEPRFIVLRHRGGAADAAPLVLVGKGLTFDAGGISLKPAKGMEEMKFDMSGGAAVLGAMRAVAELALPVNVVGLVPSTENLVSGKAMKPGDVISTRAGKTVEVVNTDAEGRLILADALDYARELSPAAVVDLATLTGSVVIALGHRAAAVLGTDESLVEELRAAGERTGERCWPLPLWDEYREQLASETADLMNVGGRPAGAITAGAFLKEFAGDVPWAHLDIAGTAYGNEPLPYQRKGAFGFPVRLLVEWVRSRVA